MNATQVVTHEIAHAQRRAAGEALLEGFGAVATIALAIIGLAGVLSTTMAAPIAAIVLGAAILFEGGIEFRHGRLIRVLPAEWRASEKAATADLQGGVAAIVLGVLALLGIASGTLLAVTLMAVGTAFLFSGRMLSGIAGVVMGILAVLGVSPQILILSGLLVLGAGLLLSGSEMFATTLAERSALEERS
jgi:hypothetical protein